MTTGTRRTAGHGSRASVWRAAMVAVVLGMGVLVGQPSVSPGAAAAVPEVISANDLGALCAAGGGHVTVDRSLTIMGGVALLTAECDITLSAGARVKIMNAYIEAQSPNGDFDICFFPACGDNVRIMIMNSTLVSCGSCGMQIRAPGSRSSITVTNTAFSSDPADALGGTNITSDGHVNVMSSHFLRDTTPGIHGGKGCVARRNTPNTAVCN
jgi:hypothetical protein